MYRRGRARASSGSTSKASGPQRSATARLRYKFDTALSKGPSVVIGWLGLITVSIIVFAALIVTAFRVTGVNSGGKLNVVEAFWQSLLRVLDSGTFAADGPGWAPRLVGLFVTVSGIFIAGSLIGLIANTVDQQIEELRKGRSNVLEADHTVILGWSGRVPAIIGELVLANESRKKAAVVIVSDTDKTEMEEVLRRTVPDTKNTRLVCRRGEPWLVENLELANIGQARSIVIIGDGNDAATVKVVLAVRALQQSAETDADRFSGHIVAEVEFAETDIEHASLVSTLHLYSAI